jgi:hypothetical protein
MPGYCPQNAFLFMALHVLHGGIKPFSFRLTKSTCELEKARTKELAFTVGLNFTSCVCCWSAIRPRVPFGHGNKTKW